MILGLGMDISEVARVKASLDRFGENFLRRILHPAEIAYCRTYRDPTQYVAVRFAAKEAISKAFGTGIGAQLGWHDMEICRKESGEPFVLLHGGGQKLFEARRAGRLLISLSHTENYVAAVAILEG
jgi:holo-[acyl-carrier protein] synthase